MIDFKSRLKGGILGLCVGDALGVPVEFKSRSFLKEKPITEMIGYGTYNQLPGTWSDDSSMVFCTMDSLNRGYNLKDIAKNFMKWRNESFWTPYGIVFDIGISTNEAILKLRNVKDPRQAGNNDERSNGNGSLMRILPLAFYLKEKTLEERYQIISDVSSITHAHVRSILACFIYTEFARILITGVNKFAAFQECINTVNAFLSSLDIDSYEMEKFKRILNGQIAEVLENLISSSGYVIDSIEASIWSFLNTESFEKAVLKAINLGGDTDTNGAITGGLAGIYYGFESIPPIWIRKLARNGDVLSITEKFYNHSIS